MSDINIHQVPIAPVGYDLDGKYVMVHDNDAPLEASTVMYPADAMGGSGGGYSAPMWKEEDGDLIAGSNTFTSSLLIGASEMNFIIVNKVIEFIDEDYTFDDTTGEITRVNQWQVGDKMITPHKPDPTALP